MPGGVLVVQVPPLARVLSGADHQKAVDTFDMDEAGARSYTLDNDMADPLPVEASVLETLTVEVIDAFGTIDHGRFKGNQ